MKKILALLTVIFFTSAAMATPLTLTEQEVLKQINCQTTGFKFEKNRITFANSTLTSKDKKRLYLIKNINQKNIYIDFPEGHIGASAGLTQSVEPNQWLGYAYIPETDKIQTEGKQDKINYVQPNWACTTSDNHKSQCENYLYICEIKNIKNDPIKQLLHKKALARWSDTKVSIQNVLHNWSN